MYYIAQCLTPTWSFFNMLHYISFRSLAALLTSLLLFFLFAKPFITIAQRFFRSKVRISTPAAHTSKNDTPTMGGILIVAVTIVTMLIWCDWRKPGVWIFIVNFVGFACIGLLDDSTKIRRSKGILAWQKLSAQLVVASISSVLLVCYGISTSIIFPFFKHLNLELGYFFIAWSIFVIVGASNAVNLTDGLDGLAISALIPNFAVFSVIAYIAGHYSLAQYLYIPYAASAEYTIIGASLVGSCLGFLWYNSYPAEIFMGDVGSLALGSALAFLALVTKQELLLVIAGGIFVVETSSVIIQIISYKLRGKKIFKMAPIHHHFELLGWPESKITIRFGIISLILCLFALMTLKMR